MVWLTDATFFSLYTYPDMEKLKSLQTFPGCIGTLGSFSERIVSFLLETEPRRSKQLKVNWVFYWTCRTSFNTYMTQETELVVFPSEAPIISSRWAALPWPEHKHKNRWKLVSFTLFQKKQSKTQTKKIEKWRSWCSREQVILYLHHPFCCRSMSGPQRERWA